MKTIKLAYDAEGITQTWLAEHDSGNGGWIVTDHEGDKKFFSGCFAEALDQMQAFTLPNWGMRVIGIGGAPWNPGW
jgi:hypothetical protein